MGTVHINHGPSTGITITGATCKPVEISLPLAGALTTLLVPQDSSKWAAHCHLVWQDTTVQPTLGAGSKGIHSWIISMQQAHFTLPHCIAGPLHTTPFFRDPLFLCIKAQCMFHTDCFGIHFNAKAYSKTLMQFACHHRHVHSILVPPFCEVCTGVIKTMHTAWV
jgi:hypothetical protein